MSAVAEPQIQLQVLLVEDDAHDLGQLTRDLPSIFAAKRVSAKIHPCSDFSIGISRAADPLTRFDLIISDTYEGDTKLRNASVLKMVDSYRGARFCPLLVYSSGVKPASLTPSPFVKWADKGKPKDIDRTLEEILDTGVPQIARTLRDDLDRAGSSYLWAFLETNWERLSKETTLEYSILERLIRRRASMQFARLDPNLAEPSELSHVEGVECYVYPPVSKDLRLGEIIREKSSGEFRLVLTPHCHLTVQQGQTCPRADYIVTVRLLSASELINQETWPANPDKQFEALRRRTNVPPEVGKPQGRYWFLPAFLDIPDSYCDLLQVDSVLYETIRTQFERIAVLDAPFSESLQASFTRFYSAVGLPSFNLERFRHLIQLPTSKEPPKK